MRAVFGLVLIVGMGLAGFAVYMVRNYMNDQEAALQAERARSQDVVATVDIYGAKRAIAYGEPVTPDDVVAIKYATRYLPEGVFKSAEELFPEGKDVPRVALRPMEPLEPLMAIKLTEPGKSAGITSRLERGMRAFTINVDVSSGVSGFLRPGDRVDIYWTGTISDAQGRRGITRLIGSGIELIAVDQSADANRVNAAIARTVTVQVSPQEVAGLAQAQSTGKLSLSLVGNNDDTVTSSIEVDQSSLLGIQEVVEEAAPAPQAAPRVCTIRTRRGAEAVEIPIPCSD